MKYHHYSAGYTVQEGNWLETACRRGETVQCFVLACFGGMVLSLILWGMLLSVQAVVTGAEGTFAVEQGTNPPKSQRTADLIFSPDKDDEA